jgi:hypothetical protein
MADVVDACAIGIIEHGYIIKVSVKVSVTI